MRRPIGNGVAPARTQHLLKSQVSKKQELIKSKKENKYSFSNMSPYLRQSISEVIPHSTGVAAAGMQTTFAWWPLVEPIQ